MRAFHWNGNFTFILFFPQTFQNVDIQPLTDLSNSPLCTTLCITLYHLIYGNKNIKTYFNKPLLIECIPLLLYSNELLDHLLDLLKYFDSFRLRFVCEQRSGSRFMIFVIASSSPHFSLASHKGVINHIKLKQEPPTTTRTLINTYSYIHTHTHV